MKPLSSTDLHPLFSFGRAAAVGLRSIADQPLAITYSESDIATAAGTTGMCIASIVSALRSWGWIDESPGGARRLLCAPQDLRELAFRLEGAADARDVLAETIRPALVVTLPAGDAAIAAALANTSFDLRPTFWTREGFVHLAATAERELRVMTPFLDDQGANLLLEMFTTTRAKCKIGVLRPDSNGNRRWTPLLPALKASGAELYEYWIDRPPSAGAPRAETFHAKVVLADRETAYVGSSNLVVSSLNYGLECGALLRGRDSATLAALLDAVQHISRKL